MWLKMKYPPSSFRDFLLNFISLQTLHFLLPSKCAKTELIMKRLYSFDWKYEYSIFFISCLQNYLGFYFNIFIKRKISEPRASASESLTRTHLLSSLLIHWQSCPNLIITLKTCWALKYLTKLYKRKLRLNSMRFT